MNRVAKSLCAAAAVILHAAWVSATPPVNDPFAAATTLTGFPATAYGANEEATLEAGEPVYSSSAEASVWYRWTAPVSGSIEINTVGSSFDTMLAVWSGEDLSSLTLLAGNDDYYGLQSRVAVSVNAGSTYQVAVYGFTEDRGSITLNLNASYASGAISGTVTAPDGTTPLPGMQVYALRWNGLWWTWAAYDFTDANGEYNIGGLAAGTYMVEFSDSTGAYVREYYDNQLQFDDAAQFWVGEGVAVTDIDASLAEAGFIDGTVTATDTGLPVSGIYVAAHRRNGDWWWWSGSASTGPDGSYSITGLPAGDYRVEFSTWGTPYVNEWYDDAYDMDEAATVAVTAGYATKDIDAALDLPGSVSGRVGGSGQALSGADVWLRREGTDREYGHTQTDADGFYAFEGVAPGQDYQVKADAPGFAARWWDAAEHRDGSTRVAVVSGEETHSISFDLPAGVGAAYVDIASEPSGAGIFLDCMALGEVTPLQLQLRPAASHPLILAASHPAYVVTVRDSKYPWPDNIGVNPVEGETVQVVFNLAASAGAMRVESSPAGADVYVGTTEVSLGKTPLTVPNLAEGSHRVFLALEGYLRPRPIDVFVTAGDTNVVAVPLTSQAVAAGIEVYVNSRPDGATVYVDGLPEPGVSDLKVTRLDTASYRGFDWQSASHVVWVAQPDSTPGPMQEVLGNPGQTLWFIDGGSLTPLWPESIRTIQKRPPFAWSEAWGAHGYEVMLVPTSVPKGEAAPTEGAGGYSSGLLPMGQLGWVPDFDLPEGEYKWYVRRWLGTGFEDWVEGYVFEIVSLQIMPLDLPDGRVGSPYSAAFTSENGVDPVTWFSRLGAVTHYASSWTEGLYLPDTEGLTTMALLSGNDQYASFSVGGGTLPFALPFYGQLYDGVWVDSNGRIDFQFGSSDFDASLTKLETQLSAAPYWTDLFSEEGVLLYAASAPDRVVFEWWANQTVGRRTVPVFFTAVHWFDGRIDFSYDGEGLGAVVGLSAGDGVRSALPEQSFAGECPMGTLSFVPLALPAGMSLAPDGTLEGTPEEEGTFELIIEARDAVGQTAMRAFLWTVQPAAQLQPPTLTGTTPPQGDVDVPAATGSLFQVEIDNPDMVPVTYAWAWKGAPIGGSLPDTELTPPWSDSGTTGALVCVISATEPATELTATWQVAVDDDNDDDGYRNTAENSLETDPNDPDSFFSIIACDIDPETHCVSFDTAAGVTYQPERTALLPAAPGDWEPASAPIVGAGGTTNAPVSPPSGATHGYYRIRALLD